MYSDYLTINLCTLHIKIHSICAIKTYLYRPPIVLELFILRSYATAIEKQQRVWLPMAAAIFVNIPTCLVLPESFTFALHDGHHAFLITSVAFVYFRLEESPPSKFSAVVIGPSSARD